MNDTLQRAVLAALRVIRSGLRITISKLSFWRPFGPPTVPERRTVLAAANTINEASQRFSEGETSGTVGDLFANQGSPPSGDTGGSMGRPTATVHVPISFVKDKGETVFRTFSQQVPWDMTLDQLDILIGEFVADETESYDLQGYTPVTGQATIY